MAKKILILLVALAVCVTCYTAYALSLSEDEEFIELVTDETIMLDSPLFTQKEEIVEYKQDLNLDGFKKLLENSKFALYHNEKRGYSIRVLNKETGFIWSSNGSGASSDSVFIVKLLDKNKSWLPDALSTDKNFVEIEPVVDKSSATVTYSVNIPEDGVAFEYVIALTENGITLSLDNESIVETGTNVFANITFFPYLGASGVENNEVTIPGYVVIPSGNGGLIRYTAAPTINQPYSTAFYGTDLNFYQDTTKVGNVLSMPVYGFVHGVNQNGCLVEIKEGSAMTTFNYEAALYNGVNKYHKTYLTFNVRQWYNMSTATNPNIPMYSDRCTADLNIEYSFLSNQDANYVGIARKYQESLVGDGVLGNATLADSTQIHVEAFGREYEPGLLARKYINMTTTNDLVNINEELKLSGITDILYTLKGYYKGGFSGATPTNVNYENKLGSLNKLDDNDMNYYLYYNPVETRNDRLKLPGYSLVNVYRNEYYLEEEKDSKYTFFTDVPTIEEGVNKAVKKYDETLAIDGITQYLYGDFNQGYTRQQTYELYSSILGDAMYPMYSPNAYLLKNTSAYLNMSLYHEKLKFITDSVPFTQIVLRGYVDLYSSYINFSSSQTIDVLKCIEYGVYPAYLITEQASHELSDSLSNNLYATEYSRVRDKMFTQYKLIKSALDNVIGAQIVGREVLAVGVVKVTYNNGVSIVVNYNTEGFEVIK